MSGRIDKILNKSIILEGGPEKMRYLPYQRNAEIVFLLATYVNSKESLLGENQSISWNHDNCKHG